MSELNLQNGLSSELMLPGQEAFVPWDFKSPELEIRFIGKAFQKKERRDKIVTVEKKGK